MYSSLGFRSPIFPQTRHSEHSSFSPSLLIPQEDTSYRYCSYIRERKLIVQTKVPWKIFKARKYALTFLWDRKSGGGWGRLGRLGGRRLRGIPKLHGGAGGNGEGCKPHSCIPPTTNLSSQDGESVLWGQWQWQVWIWPSRFVILPYWIPSSAKKPGWAQGRCPTRWEASWEDRKPTGSVCRAGPGRVVWGLMFYAWWVVFSVWCLLSPQYAWEVSWGWSSHLLWLGCCVYQRDS